MLVTTSSIRQADDRLGRVALEALDDAPVNVVVTLPAGVPEDLDFPPNATLWRFVLHGPVLDRAVCVVTHGWMGATVRALDRGITVCVVPFGRDQPEVAMLVKVAGCGPRLPAKKLTAARLGPQPCRRSGARWVDAGFAASGCGVARGADLIEEHLLTN